jgi:glycosyltransferase involved in cell wall biosynthesis
VPSFVGGGAERNCVLLANELRSRGLRVCLIVDSDRGPNRSYLSDGIEVEVLGETGYPGQISKLRRLLENKKPRGVFVQVGLSPIKYLFASWLLRTRPTSVVVYHGMYDATWRLGSKLGYWLVPLIVRLFDRTVVVSKGLRDHLVVRFNAPQKSIQVIHNPIDLSMLDSLAAESGGVTPSKLYLMSMGRLIPTKGFLTLLQAFSLIAPRIPHDLLIIGEGPQRDEILGEAAKLGLSDRVRLLGYMVNPFPLLRGADAFVLASVSEAFGNVLVEALSMGLRVISTDCPGGPREILADGEYGVLSGLEGPEVLGEAILTGLREAHDPQQARTRAADFAVDVIADQYLSIVTGERSA